jgi:hypothetical protein
MASGSLKYLIFFVSYIFGNKNESIFLPTTSGDIFLLRRLDPLSGLCLLLYIHAHSQLRSQIKRLIFISSSGSIGYIFERQQHQLLIFGNSVTEESGPQHYHSSNSVSILLLAFIFFFLETELTGIAFQNRYIDIQRSLRISTLLEPATIGAVFVGETDICLENTTETSQVWVYVSFYST